MKHNPNRGLRATVNGAYKEMALELMEKGDLTPSQLFIQLITKAYNAEDTDHDKPQD